MNFFTTFKHLNLFTRGLSIFSLTLAMTILLSTAAFAQPATPIQSLPDSAAVNQPHNVMLLWNASENAATYHLQVSDTSSFTTTTYDQSQLVDTVHFVDSLSFNTTYY